MKTAALLIERIQLQMPQELRLHAVSVVFFVIGVVLANILIAQGL